ncbi:unnamed protein product [Arctia plantaginis]|uniref:Uncharacterized protein n=1 Tax=Arctia plantaginis TaxID=874455 RepID=A0A8S1AGU0_ARCPL|nr:unnamed protein product [Arctia plantaginis]CAB3253644.1 unnamed protein product [Arctia plantaginis]
MDVRGSDDLSHTLSSDSSSTRRRPPQVVNVWRRVSGPHPTALFTFHRAAADSLPLRTASIKGKSIRQPIASEFNRVSESSRAPSLPPQLAHAALPPTTTHPARKTNKKSCPQNGRRLPRLSAPTARRPPRRFVIASPQLL